MSFIILDTNINEGEQRREEFKGIPFLVNRKDFRSLPMWYEKPVNVGREVEGIFFLGMTTQAVTGECGWIGERYHAWQRKLFIGDILGRIDLLYEGNQMDGVPLIFGVNVWNYNTFTQLKDYEGKVYPIGMPYREPFDSDTEAAELLEESLQLFENDGDKYTRYLFAFKTRGSKRLENITLRTNWGRDAGVGISAITAFTKGTSIPVEEGLKFNVISFYVKSQYYTSMDRLARKLYQFLDELPVNFPQDKPEGYKGPELLFKGTPEAELLANVYYHNIHDMATNKVEDNGMLRTSTKNAPCYGFYGGIGTYRDDEERYNYYKQIWSRDIGRVLCELIEHGEIEKCRLAAELLLKYLYDPGVVYKRPNWKRIVNASELGEYPESYENISIQYFARGKENDGHASIMIMLYQLYRHGGVDVGWLKRNFKALIDAAEWFCWQMDNPGESSFEDVLCSESESTYGDLGGYDLFSNSYAYYALVVFSKLAEDIGEKACYERWKCYADRLMKGIEKVFTGSHYKYGAVLVEPESDNWPSEIKRMASLLLMPEIFGYDTAEMFPGLWELWLNTYKAQKDVFFSPMMGGAMGYGQGYQTQAAMLLDQVEDYTQCLDWAARFSYFHSLYPYIVPEGVTYHPSGRFWYRHTDLGNALQQTEIVKCIRLIIGLDDLDLEEGLKLIPRLPDGWERIEVKNYPIAARVNGIISRVNVNLIYSRIDEGFELFFESEKPIKVNLLRIGPFFEDKRDINIVGLSSGASMKTRSSRQFAYISLNAEINRIQTTVT
jgi:hypothetical protein